MAHIRHDDPTSIATSDDGWYPVAKQVGTYANDRAHMTRITAVVSTTCGSGAAACYFPTLAELHLNTAELSFGDPSRVDLKDRLWRLEHPETVGALEHEAAHARHTRFLTADLTGEYGANKRVIDVITTLEEPRIEYNAIRTSSGARPFLRKCALEVVAKDFKVSETPYGASVAAGLMLARVDAGVLTRGEAHRFRAPIVEVLGEKTLDTLETLWQRFLRLRDEDFAGMVQIAREWLEALDLDPDADEGEGEGEDPMDDLGAGSMHGEGDGDGKGEGEGSGEGDLAKAIGKGVRATAGKVDGEIAEGRGAERDARKREQQRADAERGEASKAPHQQAFPSHGYGEGGDSRKVSTRKPTNEEQAAARRLGRVLEDLHFHDRVVTKRTREVPPGRLRGRMAVTQAAAVSQGRVFDGDLWSGKVRRNVDVTPLRLGLLSDISGSMGSAMAPLASTEYIVSAAGVHAEAKVASVHFGIKVHGVMRAGQRVETVRTYHAGDGHEAFKDGALALDRELELVNGRGARLLVVLSDGAFVSKVHADYARAFIPMAISRGVAVLFLDFTGSFRSAYGGQHVDVRGLSPVQVGALVGAAAAQEMKRMDAAQG